MFFGFQWTITFIVWIIIVDLSHTSSIKKEITCYVCTPSMIFDYTEASEIYTTFINVDIENIPTCDSNAAINFTLKCPEGYQGCLTKIYGKTILKSCHEHSITDCKIANNVKYCFCAKNLCNYASILTQISTDDEDLDQSTEDGSGLFDDWEHINIHKHTKININRTVKFDNSSKLNNSTIQTISAAELILPKTFIFLVLYLYYINLYSLKLLLK